MTPKERYLAVLHGRQPDHLPRVPILMQFAAEYFGRTYGEFAADHRVLVEANLCCAEVFGFDQVSTISDSYRETAGFGAQIEFPAHAGALCLRPLLAEDPDLARLPRPDPLEAPRMRDRIDAVRLFRERAGDRYSILGWIEGPAAEAADLRGVSNFLMDLIDEPEYARDLMGRCVATGIDFAREQIAAGVDTVGIGDAIASQVSAGVYESLVLPFEKQLVDAVHALGAFVRLHICGNITHLLPGIATMGVDFIDIDHMVGLERARRTLGPRVVLAGDLDPVACVMRGPAEAVRAGVARSYAQAGAPFMVGAGCEIPAATPPAHLHALCAPVAC